MTESRDFGALNLGPALLGNLGDLGYREMTLVQAKALPWLIKGADLLVCAKTGSGKTAAFGLGLLHKLDANRFSTQALVLCPTRELADQVAKELRRLARAIPNIKVLTLCGGSPLRSQLASLQRSPHIIVGTPGRILKHLGKQTVDLKELQTLVLDEADRMLDMGFEDELNAILDYAPSKRQTWLFSATYPDSIADISQRVQRNPKLIDVTDDEPPAAIAQSWCPVTRDNRQGELLRALHAWGGELNLVFCNTKIDCAEVAAYLMSQGIVALALHGDLDQSKRNEVLVRFSNRSASVLVATDVAARGLDVKEINAVFNYELPPQADTYIHRIGRTGRAGQQGAAISLIEKREMWRLAEIEKTMPDTVIRQQGIPDAKPGDGRLSPRMTTLQVSGGRRNKLRPGDLLGVLTAAGGIPGQAVGSIDLFDTCAYVAVENAYATKAQKQLSMRPIKGRKFRARIQR